MAKRQSPRGRKPSIAVATRKLVDMRRMLKALVTETIRLQERLNSLDSFYSKHSGIARAGDQASANGRSRRGPNVRDLAYATLKRGRKALPIRDLAQKVIRARGGKAGQQFAQNLSVALGRDPRFKRVERGVYGLRSGR